jgi:hypothetical protein
MERMFRRDISFAWTKNLEIKSLIPLIYGVPKKPAKSTRNTPSTHTLADIAVDDLLFDDKNPRLPRGLFGVDEQETIDWMVENASIIELMNSIGEQGYFPGEPLVVVPAESEPKKFYVVEGNRRLTAVKLLLNPNLTTKRKKAIAEAAKGASNKPTTLPCQIYPKRESVLHFLAFRHITGIKPWDPLMKARYLSQLADSPQFRKLTESERNRRLAHEIGSTSSYVARLFAGLAIYEELENQSFFGIRSLEETEGDRYSVLTTAVTSYANIARYLGLEDTVHVDRAKINLQHLKNLTQWLFEREPGKKARVPESRALTQLNRVIANSTALRKFEDGATLEEADLLTEGPLEVFRKTLSEAHTRLTVALEILPKARNIDVSDVENAQEVRHLANALYGAAKSTQNPED